MLKPYTYQTFTIEEDVIHHLMLYAALLKRNGLFYGKIGIAVAFVECGKYWNNPVYFDYAKELKNNLLSNIDYNIPFDFATGLSGFGWGIEYMIQNQFKDSENKEICTNIDQKIMSMNVKRITDLSLENGLEGFLHYILIRLKGSEERKTSIPFDDNFLKDTFYKLQSLKEEEISDCLYCLKNMYISFFNTGSLLYKPDVSLFTNDLNIKNEGDIVLAKLGLSDGLAGKLMKMIMNNNSSNHEKCIHH